MTIKFTKMHGIGNDYIYIDCTNQEIYNPSELAKKLSRYHTGIGADGLILLCDSDIADIKMRMFNADGSEGKMCGNGIRCVGKFAFDKGLVSKKDISVETLSGIKNLRLHTGLDGLVDSVIVDMGKASLQSKDIPVLYRNFEQIINVPFSVKGAECNITCVSVGNPHCVVFNDNIENLALEHIGPMFENHSAFPERINTEFVKVINSTRIKMRVWERGSGETMACGTGACASVVAATVNGYCKYGQKVYVELVGGELCVIYNLDGGILMEGKAETVFEGTINLDD